MIPIAVGVGYGLVNTPLVVTVAVGVGAALSLWREVLAAAPALLF